MATTTDLAEVTFVVNAWGQAAGGIWPTFTVRLDGVDIGTATAATANQSRYSFTAKVAPDQAHKLQVIYTNDGTVNGVGRDLYVKSIEVAGKTMTPTASGVTYDRFELDGKDVIAGQEGMWWDGALNFGLPATWFPAPVSTTPPPPPAPVTTSTTITVNASADMAKGVGAHFKLMVDGKVIGEATATTTAKAYSFTTNLTAEQAHKVQIQYDNDYYANGEGRNLYVKSVAINGKSFDVTGSGASFDRGALDGKDVLAGTGNLYWNGTLTLDAGKDYFPATTTPPSPPAGTKPVTITVDASADMAKGVGAHFKLMVDGTVIGDATATTGAKTYSFTANLTPDQAHKVQIQYDNDYYANGEGRNLYVKGVTIGGKSFDVTGTGASFDRGALDGKDVLAGTGNLYWDGTLVLNAGKEYFPGSTTPPPAPTPPMVSVNDLSLTEPGTTIVKGGIADGYLHTEGNQIVDSSGKAVKLTGVNWFGGEGYAFVPNGLWADSYQGHMDKMMAQGFNLIRLPYSDAMLDNGRSPNGGIDYSLNPDLRGLTSLQIFDKIIEYADKIGMKIMLDHHRSGDGASANENGLWYTDQYPESVMIKNWQMLAERYADNPSVVAADLHNEPHGAATWGDGNRATDWAAAAERIGNAIQSVNPNWLLMVEGIEIYQNNWDWWGGNLMGAKNEGIDFNVDNKLVYAPHSYGPGLYQMSWFNTNDFPNNLPAKLTESFGYLYKNDTAPILIGEFGGRFDDAQERAWISKFVQYINGDLDGNGTKDIAANEQGMSWTYWSWNPNSGDTGGILMDDWKTIDQTKMNHIKPALYQGTDTEVAGRTDAVFTVSLSKAATQTVSLTYATADGTAKAGQDYLATSGTLTFAPGETAKQVKVTVLGDSVAEGTETFSLKLGGAVNAGIADDTGLVTLWNHVAGQSQAASTLMAVDSASLATDGGYDGLLLIDPLQDAA
ncbi:cellulase family glycosylhydrolase [Azospirillum oleiclasticum]|uniref:cellulase n=3 Tax=Azospirillum oleiclasticum TaxID=2735135 RepID=A0ABX2TIN5_9PROT|nr:carbohydrate-binding domain-containing protein [Azospirillum oleiclasticum]NYZ24209.1 cellulase family glycosylhydrolase [Azospirillum oleiclasticum]